MKRLFPFVKCWMVLLSAFLFDSGLLEASIVKELHEGWKFSQVRLKNWYPATVPGVVHTDLMDNGLIEDPFFGLNERSVQWVDKEDWLYETVFDVTDDVWQMNNIQLRFKGLDTYADVYLNDKKIVVADNMFCEWKVAVKHLLKKQDNCLRIYFHSPLKRDIPKWEALPFRYETVNDQSENGGVFDRKVSVFARKAGYHYGWDWGPRLVTSGIWRPVLLEAWEDVCIEDVFVHQLQVSKQRVDIRHRVEVTADETIPYAVVQVMDKVTGKVYVRKPASLKAGLNVLELDYSIHNPLLWWCNGLGKAHLYEIETVVLLAGKVCDSRVTTTGFRLLELVREEDGQGGRSFYFRLNGVPFFVKGANCIPGDNFLPRITREKYERSVADAADANMNMLRVWGGGIYEDDAFYEACNRRGILVWQDFMFACSLYPADSTFLNNVRREAVYNIRRLRNHPSLALWCGNNECMEAWYGWGWKTRYEEQNPEYARLIWQQYEDLFHRLLPEVVAQHAPGVPYIPTSPFSRYDGVSENERGDIHYWDVWQGRKPLSEFNVVRSRFFSEYGYQSFPTMETVNCYAPNPVDHEISTEVMMAHQRGGEHANNLISKALNAEYGIPRNFEAFLYMSQLLQGDVIKMAVEAQRRDMPYCMGSLFWQHNDCWPVASWSSRDYYGCWKAQHYFTREAYRDLLISPFITDKKKQLGISIVSDRLKATDGILFVEVIDMYGKVIYSKHMDVRIPDNASHIVYTCPLDEMLGSYKEGEVVMIFTLSTRDGQNYTNHYYLVSQRDMHYPEEVRIDYEVQATENGYELSLKADKFARGVFLSLQGTDYFFNDNFFDLVPGREKKVHLTSKLPEGELRKQMKIRYLAGSR